MIGGIGGIAHGRRSQCLPKNKFGAWSLVVGDVVLLLIVQILLQFVVYVGTYAVLFQKAGMLAEISLVVFVIIPYFAITVMFPILIYPEIKKRIKIAKDFE